MSLLYSKGRLILLVTVLAARVSWNERSNSDKSDTTRNVIGWNAFPPMTQRKKIRTEIFISETLVKILNSPYLRMQKAFLALPFLIWNT